MIVPVYNDPGGIDATLQSLTTQNYDEYEIIPVDNNSSDDTARVIRQWKRRHPNQVRPTDENDVQSSYAARNAGIDHARGDLLVFIDADMTAPTEWLTNIASAFANTETDYLGYDVQVYIPDDQNGPWAWYDQIMGLPARYYYDQKRFVPTSGLAVRKAVFETVGRFDAQLISGGDREFGHRVYDHPDLTMAFSEEIKVYHPARTRFQDHYVKALRIGRGLAQSWQRSEHTDGAPSVLSDLLDHLLPPNPLRIYRQGREQGVSLYEYVLLYFMNALLRYVRVYGALKHRWA